MSLPGKLRWKDVSKYRVEKRQSVLTKQQEVCELMSRAVLGEHDQNIFSKDLIQCDKWIGRESLV
jgi:hypothetical protein